MRLPIVSSHFATSSDATAPFTARPGRIMAFEHSLAISFSIWQNPLAILDMPVLHDILQHSLHKKAFQSLEFLASLGAFHIYLRTSINSFTLSDFEIILLAVFVSSSCMPFIHGLFCIIPGIRLFKPL